MNMTLVSVNPDMELNTFVEKACQGDAEAFGKIYDKYLDTIYRFVSFRVGRREDAEDITEQIFINMFGAIKRYTNNGLPFEAWIYRIARNKIIDFYRAQKKHVNLDDVVEIPDKTPTPEDILQSNSSKEEVLRGLEKIPEQYKEIIILKFIEEKTNEEISGILEKPVTHVRVLQHRALQSLRKILDK